MNYTDKELRDIYEKKIYLQDAKFDAYKNILYYIFTVAPLFTKEEYNRMGNYNSSYSFIRELLEILNSIDDDKLKYISPDFLKYLYFGNDIFDIPLLTDFKSLIVPNKIYNTDRVGYFASIKRIFDFNALDFMHANYHNSNYNDFSNIVEYYLSNNSNDPIIEYLIFYFYANRERFGNDIEILDKMIVNYMNNREEYNDYITLLLRKSILEPLNYYNSHNINLIYEIIESVFLPKLLEKESKKVF